MSVSLVYIRNPVKIGAMLNVLVVTSSNTVAPHPLLYDEYHFEDMTTVSQER